VSARQLVRLAIGLGVLLLLWGAAALARRRETATAAGNRFTLPPITRADVDTVRIARPGDTTVLARHDSADWRVNGRRTSGSAIADLFSALADSAGPSELVAERPGSYAGLGVDSARGVRVTVVGRGKTLLDLFAGHRTPDLDGGYFRRVGQPDTWLVRGRLAEVLSRGTDEWRDRHIASVASDSVRAIEIRRGKKSYALRKSEKGWRLEPSGSTPDSTALAGLLGAYREVQADGFAAPAQADSAHLDHPDRTARLLRDDGTALLVLAFDSIASGYWVRSDTGATIFRLDLWSGDRLTPSDSTLRPVHR
jgi:hypothetical protein